MDWMDLLSNACIVFTIAVFSTGIPQCLQMVKQESTNNVPFLPYLMTNFNNIAWILYSTLTKDSTLFIVNAIGSILQTVNMVVYFRYSTSKVKEFQQTAVASLCISICWIYISSSSDKAMATNIMGMLCTIITVLMFSSPLAEMKTVVEKKSTDSISFPLTVTTFFCTILWTLYGSMKKDPYIIIPNFLGLLTSLPRFYLFSKYKKKRIVGLPADVY
ncbi:sugar transporter SWEET1-like [Styela clava]